MVVVTVEGRDFDVTSFHDMDILSFFPEGEPHVNGLLKCLSKAFDNEEADALFERMTVAELLDVWERWSQESNFDFVYSRIYEVIHDDHEERKRKIRLGLILLGSWVFLAVSVMVLLVMLLV